MPRVKSPTCESISLQKHGLHVRRANYPVAQVPIKGRSAIEHPIKSRDARRLPASKALIESGGAVEHVPEGRSTSHIPAGQIYIKGSGAREHVAEIRGFAPKKVDKEKASQEIPS